MAAFRMAHLWGDYADVYDITVPEDISSKTLTRASYERAKGEYLHRVLMMFAMECGDDIFQVTDKFVNFDTGSVLDSPIFTWKNGKYIIRVSVDAPFFFGGIGGPALNVDNEIASIRVNVCVDNTCYYTSVSDIRLVYFIPANNPNTIDVKSTMMVSGKYIGCQVDAQELMRMSVADCGALYIDPKTYIPFQQYLSEKYK